MTWNLSDKILMHDNIEQLMFWADDVQEFIKRLKEELCYCCNEIKLCNDCQVINELAGSALI